MPKKPATRSCQEREPQLKTIRDEIAARYRAGHDRRVADVLRKFGNVETYPSQRMIVLHRAASSKAAVDAALKQLQRSGDVEFVTPVLLDVESNTRQVLTDEIVLRLKPGCTERSLAALKAEHGIRIGRRNKYEPTQYIVKVPKPSGTQTLDIARSLDRSADVEFACPNFLSEPKR